MPSSTIMRHVHGDGRICTFFNFDGQWRHWDHPDPEPGPHYRVQYLCEREHDVAEVLIYQRGDRFQHPGANPNQSWCSWDGVQWTYTKEPTKGRIACSLSHPLDSSNYKPAEDLPCSCERRGPHRLPDPGCSTHGSDRGEFGMPTVGRLFDSFIPGEGQKVMRVCDIMDEALTLYKRKAAGYTGVDGDTANHLGAKGQFADINRKFWRLKAMLWDEVVPMYPDAGAGETVEEILMDLIGHAALTIDFLRESQGHGEEAQ